MSEAAPERPSRARVALRRLLPWIISAAALGYVFGWLTDWERLLSAMRHADLPVFVAVTFADKLLFFLMWTFLQVTAIRRLVGPVSISSLIALRGGSELLRALSNPLADGAFLLGLIHLTRGNPTRVVAAATIPALVHSIVLLGQATIALPFLEGGLQANRDVAVAVASGWLVVIGVAITLRTARTGRSARLTWLRERLEQLEFRAFAPMLGWFVVLALCDITVQWLATRAFGVDIAFSALAARIPILYVALALPSFGNFGTREVAWSWLFADYGPRHTLVAYAISTNGLFLLFNVAIGVVFFPRAVALVRELWEAQRKGEPVPQAPLLRDVGEP